MIRWRRAAPVVVCALAVATTLSTFGSWGASGDRTRNSYAIVDVVERAGVLSASSADLSGLWYFVPALCGLVLLCSALGRVAIAGALATTLGALVAAGGALVARSPLMVQPAATFGTLVGLCTILAGALALLTTTTRRNDE